MTGGTVDHPHMRGEVLQPTATTKILMTTNQNVQETNSNFALKIGYLKGSDRKSKRGRCWKGSSRCGWRRKQGRNRTAFKSMKKPKIVNDILNQLSFLFLFLFFHFFLLPALMDDLQLKQVQKHQFIVLLGWPTQASLILSHEVHQGFC